MLQAMQAWGAPQHEIDALKARLDATPPSDDEIFDVHADNWHAVMAFVDLGARWVYAGLAGVRTGFDWPGVEAWIDRHIRRRHRRRLSRELGVMERAALQADRELKEKEE